LGALVELWTSVFEAPAEVFTCEYKSFTPENRKTFVADSDGRLVGSVQLFGIPVYDEHKAPVMMGGIANVSTLPEFRSSKIATNLLKAAIEEMQAREYGWSMLLTGKHSFYEPLGWRTVHRSYLQAQIDPSALPDTQIEVVLDTGPDLIRLRSIYECSFKTPLSRIRTDLDWAIRIPERIKTKAVFMSADSYVIAREYESKVYVEEWGMPNRSVEAFLELLLAVTRWAVARGIRTLVVSAPIRAEARHAYETLFQDVESIEETEAMVRPISPDWPMSRLLSLFLLPRGRFFRMDNF